ncbi:hypothetical protein KIPB_004629 [Kipferlia bialata]|uniref:Uncharacterized protein n=1 Tax=Kipferlia bialata TaxID=797122 RepID=A0A9K3GIB8_9EUKA|nr:hypothetical protein KIPB_004629 [Kipferlia bialata]|eukprot:g4629.t1
MEEDSDEDVFITKQECKMYAKYMIAVGHRCWRVLSFMGLPDGLVMTEEQKLKSFISLRLGMGLQMRCSSAKWGALDYGAIKHGYMPKEFSEVFYANVRKYGPPDPSDRLTELKQWRRLYKPLLPLLKLALHNNFI